ncbi:MAG: condensation domain-containing protein, partial [Terriglobia bacterium]
MWFLHQLAPRSAAYNVGYAARIRKAVDVEALRRSLEKLIDRHTSLRMTFSMSSGELLQKIQSDSGLYFEIVEASSLNSEDLHRRILEAHQTPFDLERGPLFRVNLYRCSSTEYLLMFNAHHIICDGWSIGILSQELIAHYEIEQNVKSMPLPLLTIDYADFVDWQNHLLAGPSGQKMWEYWRDQLSGNLPVVELPFDHPRPSEQNHYGDGHSFQISGELSQLVKRLATDAGTTIYTIFLAAYGLLLNRYTHQDDILIGVPTLGRSRAEFFGVVGNFVNTIPLRLDFYGNPNFEDLLKKFRQTLVRGLENQDFPFSLLVDRLEVPRFTGQSPIYQTTFNLLKSEVVGEISPTSENHRLGTKKTVPGLFLEPYPFVRGVGQFDLSMEVLETSGTFEVILKYNTDLFEWGTIERMAGHFQRLLEGIVLQPSARLSELPLLPASEREYLVRGLNATDAEYPERSCVHELVEEQVRRTPEAVAVVFGEKELSYRELNARANQFAHYLREQGVGPEVLVALCVERSVEMLVCLLGILKAGGAYVPLDPQYPAERLSFMLEDSGAAVVVTEQAFLGRFEAEGVRTVCLERDGASIAGASRENPESQATAENLAYVIYTSGSTGKPKGVMIPHGAVVNFLTSMQREPGIETKDVLLAVTTLSFDIAGLELYLPLVG